MAPAKKSSSAKASAKAPAKKPMVVAKPWAPAKKSQYELERDARIKRNEEWMIAHGFNPYGSGPLNEIKKKAPPRPRAPKKYVPESERRRSPRLAGETIAPKRLTSNSDTFCRIVPLEEGGADAVFGVAGFRTGNEDPAGDGEPDGKDE